MGVKFLDDDSDDADAMINDIITDLAQVDAWLQR